MNVLDLITVNDLFFPVFHFCLSSISQVFVDQLTCTDIEFIGESLFPSIDKEIISKMVVFNNTVGFSFSAAPLYFKNTQIHLQIHHLAKVLLVSGNIT